MERRHQNRVTLRMYLPDFIQNLDSNVDELQKLYNENHMAITLYLWYDKNDTIDLDVLKEFIKTWESKKYFRTIIKSNFTNFYREFIWFDIVPFNIPHSDRNRFRYQYVSYNKVLDGLQEFYNVTKFTTSDKPVRKQKRNDYAD